ncbi:cobalt transporter [Chordicoccus furentiruminis]|uniref:cobalt transporter n=1 Tax=Chordicoccus furentiruminis TaxID=2709410 RepID=UPI0023A8AE0C|nr:cobalt transporter [Chordicoccus furentiruminis]
MHDLGYPHEHDHAAHGHEHEHHHGPEGDVTPKEEMIAMLRYMVGHNASHLKETAELAEKIRGGNAAVYEEIQQAVSEFGKGNAILEDALRHLEA